ncbi:hypothetical protein BDP27DRAFT_1317092 [Rhodocollybia butyracea]|uniref:Uncharacterized protein n=1 Tax=Rhodocollybia butyracea TaxID=206335 RepID=A0A9P5Q3L2_9AGAR|nr:hypothetical protein BDP27DRAFT_1317092 [Rhodocollybia butyracea]
MTTNLAPGELPTPSCRGSPLRDGHKNSAFSPVPNPDKPDTNATQQETSLAAMLVDSSTAKTRAVAQYDSLQDALSRSMEYNNLPENIYRGLPIVPPKKRGAKRSRSTAPAGSGSARKRSRRDEVDQEPGSWVLDKVPNKLPLAVPDKDKESVVNDDDETDKDTATADVVRLFVVSQTGHVLPTWAQSLPQPSSSSALYFEAITATRNVNTRFVRQSMLPKDRQVGEDVMMEDGENKKGWLFSILDRHKDLKRTSLNDLHSLGSSAPDPSLLMLPRVRLGCFLPRETNEAVSDLNEQGIPNRGTVSNGPDLGDIAMDVDVPADDSDAYSQVEIAVLDDGTDGDEEASSELGIDQLIDDHTQEQPVLVSGSTSVAGAASTPLPKRTSRNFDSAPTTPHRSSARVAAKSPVKSTPSQVKPSVKAKPTATKSKPVIKPPTEDKPSASSSAATVKGTKDNKKQGRPTKANSTPRNAKGKGKAKERVVEEQAKGDETDVDAEAISVPLKLDLRSDSNAVIASGSTPVVTSESDARIAPECTPIGITDPVSGPPEPKTNALASDETETRKSRRSTQRVSSTTATSTSTTPATSTAPATSDSHNPYMSYVNNPSALSYMSTLPHFTPQPNTSVPPPTVNSSTLNTFVPPPPMIPAPNALVPHSLYTPPVIRAEDILQSLPTISALPIALQTYLLSALAGGVTGVLPPAFGGAPGIDMSQIIGSNSTGPLLSSSSTASAPTPSSTLPTQAQPYIPLSSTVTALPVNPGPGHNTRSSRNSSSVHRPTRQSKKQPKSPKSPNSSSMEIKPPMRRRITQKKNTKGIENDLVGDTKRSFIRSVPAETAPVASGSGSADADTDAEGEVDLNFFAPYVVDAMESNHFLLS